MASRPRCEVTEAEAGFVLKCDRAPRQSRAEPLSLPPPAVLSTLVELRLSLAQLTDLHFVQLLGSPMPALTVLDLSRNYLKFSPLPAEWDTLSWATLRSLREADFSHNQLHDAVPLLAALAMPASPPVERLSLRSNSKLKTTPAVTAGLARLPALQTLDVRWNPKLQLSGVLAEMPACQVEVVEGCYDSDDPDAESNHDLSDHGNSAAVSSDSLKNDHMRWPTLIEQLMPLSTPEIRARLFDHFGIEFPIRGGPKRTELLVELTRQYAARNGRPVDIHASGELARPLAPVAMGIPLPKSIVNDLLEHLRATSWTNSRSTVATEGYIVIERNPANTKRGRREKAKQRLHSKLWSAAEAAISKIDATSDYTAVAFSRGFKGSPHIDRLDIGYQWCLSCGDWSPDGGGKLCVESGFNQVTPIDTRGRLARVDGRFPHWVSPYEGERFSVIWFRAGSGKPAPLQRFGAQQPTHYL